MIVPENLGHTPINPWIESVFKAARPGRQYVRPSHLAFSYSFAVNIGIEEATVRNLYSGDVGTFTRPAPNALSAASRFAVSELEEEQDEVLYRVTTRDRENAHFILPTDDGQNLEVLNTRHEIFGSKMLLFAGLPSNSYRVEGHEGDRQYVILANRLEHSFDLTTIALLNTPAPLQSN